MVAGIRRSTRLAKQPEASSQLWKEQVDQPVDGPAQGDCAANAERASARIRESAKAEASKSAGTSSSSTPAPETARTSAEPSQPSMAPRVSIPTGPAINLPEEPIPLFDFYLELGTNPGLDSEKKPYGLYDESRVFLAGPHSELKRVLSDWKNVLETALGAVDAAPSPANDDKSAQGVEALRGKDKVKAMRGAKTFAKGSSAAAAGSNKRKSADTLSSPATDAGPTEGRQDSDTLSLEIELFATKCSLSDLGAETYAYDSSYETVLQVVAHAPPAVIDWLESESKEIQKLTTLPDFSASWRHFPQTEFERLNHYKRIAEELTLGYIVPSAIVDKSHPLCHLQENLLAYEWVTLYGEVILREPFFPPEETIIGPDAEHAWGRAVRSAAGNGYSYLDPKTNHFFGCDSPYDSPLLRVPSPRVLGEMLVEVGLGPRALLYGADGTADGFIETMRDLPASVPPNSMTLAKSMRRFLPFVIDWSDGFLEVNAACKSFWDECKSFYALPSPREKLTNPARLAVEDRPSSPKKQAGRGYNRRRKADAGFWRRQYNRNTAASSSRKALEDAPIFEESDVEAKEEDESYLPLDINVASLLEMCRPPRDGPTRTPPAEMIPTPLLPYQARCLAWMVDRETSLDDEVELIYPTWLAIKTKSIDAVIATRRRAALEWKRKLAVHEHRRELQRQQRQQEEEQKRLQEQVKKEGEAATTVGGDQAPTTSTPAKKAKKLSAKAKGKGKVKADAVAELVTEAEIPLKEPFTDPVELDLFYDEVSGMMSLRRFTCRRREPGGVLCESMGLGKTLESLALIACNPCPSTEALTPSHRSRSATIVSEMDSDELKPLLSRATLVVCPASLMEQWLDEIRKHFRSARTEPAAEASRDASIAGQDDLVQPGVVRFSDEHFKWDRGTSRDDVRQWTAENLVEPDIVVASYEDLAAQLSLSQRTTDLGSGPRSPLLEVLWWRVMLDEAQIVASSPNKATSMVHELWRVNCWMVTGTPVTKGIKDLHGIFGFLDHDPLASLHIFRELLERPFTDAEVEGIRRMRAVLPRYMWRHTKVHVQDEIALPPSQTEWLELELPEVERLFYEREVKRWRDVMARRAGRGFREPGDVKFLVTLRQLLSHPQVAQQLGYGAGNKRLTFDQLFSTLCAKSDAELNTLRKETVLAILQLVWGQDFYAEERNKRRWTAGPPVLSEEEVSLALHRALKICWDALESDKAMELDGDGHEHELNGANGVEGGGKQNDEATSKPNLGDQAYRPKRRGKRKSVALEDDEGEGHVPFRWTEALYWVKTLLKKRGQQQQQRQGNGTDNEGQTKDAASAPAGEGNAGPSENAAAPANLDEEDVEEPAGHWDPGRATRVFFEKTFKNANDKSVDLNDPRFHLIVQDAGSEDMDEAGLDDLIEAHRRDLKVHTGHGEGDGGKEADDNDNADGKAAAPSEGKRRKTSPKNRGGFEPTLKKSRLRGNAGQRQQARVWYYKPREKLSTTHTKLKGLLARQEVKEREVAFLHTRRDEVLGPSAGDDQGDDDEEGEDAIAECGVCLETMLSPGVLPCYHSFCLDCLQKLAEVAGGGRCPNCRIRFAAGDITEIIRTTEKPRKSPDGGDDDVVVGDFGGKITGLIRDLRKRLRQDPAHKAVIFSHWKTMLSFIQTALLENGVGAVVFAGGSTSQSNALTSIRDDPDTKVILVPFRASEGAAGLTLTCCDLAYLMEPAMDGALEAQAIGRINRIGQGRPTTVIRVKMKDTIEHSVIEIAEEKARQGLVKLVGGSATTAQQDAAAAAANGNHAAGDNGADLDAATPLAGGSNGIKASDKPVAPSVAELRAQSISASLSSTVGAAKTDSESSHQLTMQDVAKILGFDIEEERRLELERRRAAAEAMRQEMERMGYLAGFGVDVVEDGDPEAPGMRVVWLPVRPGADQGVGPENANRAPAGEGGNAQAAEGADAGGDDVELPDHVQQEGGGAEAAANGDVPGTE